MYACTKKLNRMTEYLVYTSFAFVGFQFFNVLLNFLFPQKIKKTDIPFYEKVSILIPARNEEKNIGNLLESIIQHRDEKYEIIVFNDNSTDRTEEIVRNYIQRDSRIQLINSTELPHGWLGKNYACHQLAQNAYGNYLLFLDADVVLSENVIDDVIAYAKNKHLKLLSIFPYQLQLTRGEKASVPVMHYILLTLLPLIFVRISPFWSHAAANGQFMLFEADTYKKMFPHKKFKNSPVEDIQIARYYKKMKYKIACIIGEERIKCRMYKSCQQALNGFSKNIFMFFGNSPIMAFLFWIMAALGFIPVWLYNESLLFLYFTLLILIQFFYAIRSKQNPFITCLYFPVHLIFMFHVMLKAIFARKKKNNLWKERNIYLSS